MVGIGYPGLAPYWFEVDVTAYLGNSGRTAIAAEAEYELLLTQRLILQSTVGLTAYGKDDAINGIGKGVCVHLMQVCVYAMSSRVSLRLISALNGWLSMVIVLTMPERIMKRLILRVRSRVCGSGFNN